MSSSAVWLVEIAPARSARLLADVAQFDQSGGGGRPSVLDRLAVALGQDLAERIVEALSDEAVDTLDVGLSAAFADHLAAALAKEVGDAV
jgi:hypothetical protein